jgi:3-oxoacyl-[acyl-carrier protein] reductase
MNDRQNSIDPDLDFGGKTILVTGSGRNLGRAVILEFAGRGANVIINSRSNRDEAESVKEEAEALGAKALVIMGEASDPTVVAEFKRQAEDAFGRVDIYLSNANRRLHKNFFETSDEDWHYHLNQQLTASWYLAKAFVPGMREAGYGRILHMNGPDGFHGMASRIPAASGKGGLRILTKSLAEELGQYGITVNDINPGFSDTIRDLTTHPQFKKPEVPESFIAQIPIRRATELSEVAFTCAFLCSPRAGAISGNTIHVDGGLWRLS